VQLGQLQHGGCNEMDVSLVWVKQGNA